jgi:hypothetical protein
LDPAISAQCALCRHAVERGGSVRACGFLEDVRGHDKLVIALQDLMYRAAGRTRCGSFQPHAGLAHPDSYRALDLPE